MSAAFAWLSLARGGCGGWRAWLVGVCGSVAGSGFSGGVCRPLGKGGPHVLTPTRVRARACSLYNNSIGYAGKVLLKVWGAKPGHNLYGC